ncbi:MAG: hypothetical protein EXS32_09155 [Opitutus sp.]|nr:hypothetical protein [Opitutus sp.]
MKPPRLLVGLLPLLTALVTSAAPSTTIYELKPGPGAGRHIVFLTGDEEYRGEEGLPMLAKILSQRHGFKCTVLFALDPDGTINPDNSKSVGGAEALASADAIVMLLRWRAWPDDAMKLFAEAVARGVPIIGLRTATHSFLFRPGVPTSYVSYNNFGREVLGENWVSHWGPNRRGATRGVVEPGAESDPIMRGVSDLFGDSGAYEVHPADAKILVRGQVLKGMSPTDEPDTYREKRSSDQEEQGINDPLMAVAWTRRHENPGGKANRVFCTTMGAATDLVNEGLRRLVVNAVYWGFGLDVPARANVAFVDAYAPSPYAFKGYRRGLTPADHALGLVLRAGEAAPAKSTVTPVAK